MTKRNSGITLVALVVTMLALLILSGMTIAVLNGENSIINNAMKSKEETEYAQIKEEVLDEWYKLEFEQAKSYFDFSEMDETFQDKLKEKDEGATVEYIDSSETLEISYKGHTMNLTEKGKIIENKDAAPVEKATVTIAAHPQSKDIFVGGTAQLTATATGDGDIAYQWYKSATDTNVGGTAITGATSSTYSITNASEADRYYYYCVATATANGKTDSAKTDTAYVKVINRITADALSVAQNNVNATTGGTLTMGITANAEGNLTYQWYYISPAQAGQTPGGSASEPGSGTPGTDNPGSGSTNPGSGTPGSGSETNPGSGSTDPTTPGSGTPDPTTTPGTAIPGATQATYTKENASESDTGYYYCVITQTAPDQPGDNAVTITGPVITAKVEEATTPKITPTITLSSDNGTIEYDESATFTVATSVPGTIQVTTSNAQAVQITAGNNSTTTTSPTQITYRGTGATEDPVTITITFTPTNTEAYTQATATYTVAHVNRAPATAPTRITAYTGTYDGLPHGITISPDHQGGTLKYRTSEDNGATYTAWETYTEANKPTRTNQGTTRVQLYVEGDANHTDTAVQTTNIHIGQATMEVTSSNYTGPYDGEAHGITLTVTKPEQGYTIYYSIAQALHQGNFTQGTTTKPTRTSQGTTTVYWYIDPNGNTNYAPMAGTNTINITEKSIESDAINITVTPANYTYNGTSQTPAVTIIDTSIGENGQTLAQGTDYELTYPEDVTNAGTKTITITGQGNYTGINTTATYTIAPKSIASSSIAHALSSLAYTYNRNEQKPEITITDNERRVDLVAGQDYTITYPEDVTNAGTKTITITGQGNYASSKAHTYTISPKDANELKIELTPDTFVYNGQAQTPSVKVKDGDIILQTPTEYTYTATNNTNVGTATLTITGQGNYTNTKTANYCITEKEATNFTIELSQTEYIYDGTAKTPTVTVKDGDKTLTQGTDYEQTITNNINAGSALVTIVGKGNYDVNSTKTANFTIKRVPITVTAGSATKAYDGSALTKNEVTLTEGSLVQGQTLTGTAEGTITNIGSVENKVASVTIKDANNQDTTENYQITKQSGTLAITGASTTINYANPGPVVVGNIATLTANISPAVEGKWTIQAGSEVEIKTGNNTTGTTATFTYQGANEGTTDIILTFTPTNSSYAPATTVFATEVLSANYQVAEAKYHTLADAYDATPANGTITVLQNCEDQSAPTINRNINLNLATFTITKTENPITVDSLGTLNINAQTANNNTGTITSNNTSTIIANGGTLNVNSGNIINTASHAISLQNGGIANIGQQAEAFSEDAPMVTGETHGILATSGTWNFYNGGVRGKTQCSSQPANLVRNGYVFDADRDATYEVAYLTEEANAPVLTQGMIPVKYNEYTKNWVICSVTDPDWYSYTAHEKKWANIMLSDGTYNASSPIGTEVTEEHLGSMFTWVPRYAYSIVNYYKTSNTIDPWVKQNNIKIKFLNGNTNEDREGVQYGTDYNIDDYPAGSKSPMIVHPTFTSQGRQLYGVWIAKFEASNNFDNVAVLPNKTSWRNIVVGEMQYQSARMSENTAYGWQENTVSTHLIKNSEWGATAYLCYSRYGATPMLNGYSGYVTGMGPSSSTSEAQYTNSSGHEYNTENGKLASTTQNTYGIYDMSGGAFDFTSSFINNGHPNLSAYGNSTSNTEIKYFNNDNTLNSIYSSLWEVYETSELDNSSIWNAGGGEENNKIRQQMTDETVNRLPKGIGMNETSNEWSYFGVLSTETYGWIYRNNYTSSTIETARMWNRDRNLIGSGSLVFLHRGGVKSDVDNGGILEWNHFTGNYSCGSAFIYNGFRPTILPGNPGDYTITPTTSIALTSYDGTIVLGNGNLTAGVTTTGSASDLEVASSASTIATAQIAPTTATTATLTIIPQAVGTAEITITDRTTNATATYHITVTSANYSVAGTNYTTLSDAYLHIGNHDTIDVLSNNTDSSSFEITTPVTLNLGAYTITRDTASLVVANGGTLTINATTENQTTGTIRGTASTISVAGGAVNINSGSIISTGANAINLASGSVNIGRQGDTLSENTPLISGGTYGMFKANGTWNFYNGNVQGTNMACNAEPSALRTGYIYDHTTENNYNIAFLTAPANAPLITQGMIPIKYSTSKDKWVICSVSDPEWYSYTAKDQRWANVMLSDGTYNVNSPIGTEVAESDLGSMFVWIPRYAYSIQRGFKGKNADGTDVSTMTEDPWVTNTKSQNIRVQYLVDGTNSDIDGVTYPLDYNIDELEPGSVTPMIVHPTFTSQTNFVTGEQVQLPGVWIAKFEASGTNQAGNAVGNNTNGGETVEPADETTIVKSLPSKVSWRNITIGNMQYQSTQMSTKSDYGWTQNTVDTHLIKNSEWGSASYLTYSRYGTIPMLNGCGNTSPKWYDSYTGMGPVSSTYEALYSASSRNEHEYNTSNGQLASTTGNTYGIYDMSGGSWEYVATYLDNKSIYLHYGNSSNVTYFNRTGTTTDNQPEYELNPTYSALWEKYQVSDEERNDIISVEGVGTLTRKQLYDASGSSYTNMTTNIKYDTARKRLADAIYNLMSIHKGIGVNEITESYSYWGVGSSGSYRWKTRVEETTTSEATIWNKDAMRMGHIALLFINRGGRIDQNTAGGIFSYNFDQGNAVFRSGFRPSILPDLTNSNNMKVTPNSGTIVLGAGNLTATVETTSYTGSLSVSTSNSEIATAEITQAVDNRASLTITPHTAGTAIITITESAQGSTVTYTANIQSANYSVAGNYYNTLATAVASANSGDTINVLQDAIDDDTVGITKDITLDLAGHTITRNTGAISVANGGTLNLNGTNGTIISTGSYAIGVTGGTLNINNGKIVNNTGIAVNQTSGTINIGRSEDSFIDVDDSDASLVIDGGSYGIYSTGGTWNLYNGYVAGTTAGSNTDASNVRNGYIYDTESYGEEAHSFLTAKANAPVLTQGMIPIKYTGDETTGKWTICSTTDPEWYSYTARGQKWANIMLSDGRYKAQGSGANSATVGTEVAEADLGSMFVWVPRYAYSIQRGYMGKDSDGTTDISTMTESVWQTNDNVQNIKVKYLVGTTNNDIEGNTYGTDYDASSINPGQVTPMITHPTFTTQTNFISGIPTQLPGIWVAKFEASGTNQYGNAVGNHTNGGETVEPIDGTTIVKSLPSKISWRNIKIGDMQYQSTQMSTKTDYGWSANTVDTHLIKNSEWGATAYLTYSRYGTVPMINGCGTVSTRTHDLYTGMGPASPTSEGRYDATSKNGHEYNTDNGQLASTTGNTYGIYDMSGGSWEYIATYLDNKHNNLNTGNSTNVTYFNRTGTTTDNQAEYELNPTYSALWESYQVSDEERNNSIAVEGVGTLTKKQLWDASGSSYTNMTTNIKYNTARKRLTDATYNLMSVHKGIGVNEVAGSHSYHGVGNTGAYAWKTAVGDTGSVNGRAWNNDYVLIGHAAQAFVIRGGDINVGASAGVLRSGADNGYGYYYIGFRAAILPEETASTNINITPSSGTVVLGNGNLSATVYVTAQAGALSVSSSDDTIATASLTGVSNGQATLTITPHQAGTARITVTEAGGETAVYTANIQQANYSVAGNYYNTLASAYAVAPNNGTITVLQDAIDESTVAISKNITLELGTHTITRNNGTIHVSSNGTLTINSQSGTIISTSSNTINVASGTLNINGGKIIGNSNYAINQTGGTINIGRSEDSFIDVDDSEASLVVDGGSYGIYSTGGNWNLYNGYVAGATAGSNTDASNVRNGYTYDIASNGGNKVNGFLTANANAPVLTQGMIPIKYTGDVTTGKWTICSSSDPEWYSYTARGQKWANIMLSDGRYKANGSGANSATVGTEVAEADLGSMFVWVPRYAYSIVHGYQGKDSDGTTAVSTMTENVWETNEKPQNIKVQYLVGTTNSDIEGNTYGTDYDMDSVNPGGVTPMITHPTFTTQTNFISGNPTQLPGIWVAKFEASGTNQYGRAVGNYTNGEATTEPTDATTIVKSLPSKVSWRDIRIGDMQYQSTQMSTKTDYGWSANTVDTHLIKNSEWGATAYLTYSKYGTVPMINGCGTTSPRWYDLYTGMGPASSTSEGSYNSANRSGHEYNTSNGQLASTTGNTYGIYDMSGGSWEYTATYLDNKHSNLANGNSTDVTYFNRVNTTPVNEYELNPTYSSLWEKYDVSSEERNNTITVEGVNGTLRKDQLWNANGSSYTDMAVNIRYNTARKRLTDANYNLMAVHKGIGVNEVAGSHSYHGAGNTGAYAWKTAVSDTGQVCGRAWNNDYVLIGHAAQAFVKRGGYIINGVSAGVLYSAAEYGGGHYGIGFRAAILPEETASTNINITPSSGTVVLGNGNLSATVYVTAQAGALSVSSSDDTIATASLTGVSNGQATLTVVPHQAGTARITVTEANGETAVYTANIQQANYSVAGRYFNTLATAVISANSGDTIAVLQDCIDTNSVVIAKNVALDLGGHTISRETGTIYVSSGGTFTTYNGNINSTASFAISQTGGTVNIGRENDTFVDLDEVNARTTTSMSAGGVSISGEHYGVYSTGGNWNLYNGAVLGSTAGANTDASAVRTGYIYDEDTNSTYAKAGFLTAKANAPVLTEGMIPVKYNETNKDWVICSTTDPDWYSYTARGQKWANIMLSDGTYKANGTGQNSATVGTEVAEDQLGSMFVWIPRYAYSIVRGYQGKEADGTTEISTMNETPAQTNVKAQNIKVQYLVDGTNTDVEGRTYATDYDANSVNPGGVTPMITHPTFTSQTNFVTGNATQLPGVWIAKFEASGTNSSGNAVGNCTNGGEAVEPTDATTIVKSLPSKVSWRHIQIGNMQYQSTQMSTKTDYGWTANTIDTHLIKNSEWGATAYLTYSRYGTVPMINGCGTTSPKAYDWYTGMGPASSTSEGRYNSANRSGHEYNTPNGQLASTTGNTYGIYDMSGGSWEYTATYLDNKHSNLANGNGTGVTYFNRVNTTPVNEYELNPTYASLWEKYDVSSEERNNTITVEGVNGTLRKDQLWNANGSSYTDMAVNIRYNTARKRLIDATYNLMQVHKGISVNEVAGSHAFYGVTSSGSYNWMLTPSTTGYGRTWNNDYVLIGHAAFPFVTRGGNIEGGAYAGVLYSYVNDGYGYGGRSFRATILPQ